MPMRGADPMVDVTLTLAILTYRGFYYRRIWDEVHDLALRRAVQDGLRDRDVRAAIGDWRLVWGPATGQIGEDFDASAMCVVRNATRPSQLVVAVRGTNPLSFTDWIAGDLDVATLVPWPFDQQTQGKRRASLSRSTAFGLNLLLRLTSPQASAFAYVFEGALDIASGFVPELAAAAVRRIPLDRKDVTRPLASALGEVERQLLQETRLAPDERAAAVGEKLGTNRKRASRSIGWPPPRHGAGATLVDFLRTEAKNAALEVVVTGHSKGGALAPALALWLAETRAHWDPTARARIGCYAFAGPTPGNGAFGRRVGAKLDGPSRRVVNTNDIVTHAWDDAGIASIPDLYGRKLGWLRPIAGAVREQLKANDYEPVDIDTEEFRGKLLMVGKEPDASPLQIVHQHVDAYLEWTGLAKKGIDTLKLVLA
jgi:Lipase (class 3)